MYKENMQKVMVFFKLCALLILFTVFSVLYFPSDAFYSQNLEESLNELPVIDIRASFPESFRMEVIYADMPRIQGYKEKQATWQEEQNTQMTLEDKINSYIDEIVTTNYPELNQTVIQAIIYNESRYTPEAVNSSSGTMGLMQISPKWHTERAYDLGVTDLLDPYGNILVGCDILAEIIRDTGSIDYALDVFAGGYSYANDYIGSVSPYRANISKTVSMINSGEICF